MCAIAIGMLLGKKIKMGENEIFAFLVFGKKTVIKLSCETDRRFSTHST